MHVVLHVTKIICAWTESWSYADVLGDFYADPPVFDMQFQRICFLLLHNLIL